MAHEKKPALNYGNQKCPVSTTIRMIGGKYKAFLLWHLTGQTLRFNQLHRLIPEATPKMLTQQLRELEEDGLIVRTVYPVVPPRVEYSLTVLGKSLFPILEAMYAWGSSLMEQEGIAPECSMTGNFPQAGHGACASERCSHAQGCSSCTAKDAP